MVQDNTVKRTPLHGVHLEIGARMAPFAGFDMPVQYSGILEEHFAVRENAGLFDVSHMGEVMVTGPRTLAFVQRLVSNDASKLYDGKAMYTVMCRPDGGIVDDLLVYRLDEEQFMLVINAANIATDYRWMLDQNQIGAQVENISDDVGLVALQGPKAFEIMETISPVPLDDLKFYHFIVLKPGSFFGSDRAILSRTGYTGEPGLEIYCDADKAPEIWKAIMESGSDSGLKPAGLGARDTLRLESGFCLYGNDITTETNPLEAGLGWLTKLETDDFVGKSSLLKLKALGVKRRFVGFVAQERGIPRQGNEIQNLEGRAIGTVTSGSQSPVLRRGIGMGYVPNDASFTAPGSGLRISARGKSFEVMVKKPPFHKE
ncbi:MAG: glycine cleavage system aminomethyltransferase GcvT [Bacteroidetes bacterium]|nr:glycine cleavage system aminomethyltransferase GcvT [Bacteroidota bacterium]